MHKNCLNKVEKFCQKIRQGSYFICTVCYRRVTRNFLGQGSFVLIRAVRQTFTYNKKERFRSHKIYRFFGNFILNEKFYKQMTTIRALFSPNQGTFFQFSKKSRGDLLFPPPSSYAPVLLVPLQVQCQIIKNENKSYSYCRIMLSGEII